MEENVFFFLLFFFFWCRSKWFCQNRQNCDSSKPPLRISFAVKKGSCDCSIDDGDDNRRCRENIRIKEMKWYIKMAIREIENEDRGGEERRGEARRCRGWGGGGKTSRHFSPASMAWIAWGWWICCRMCSRIERSEIQRSSAHIYTGASGLLYEHQQQQQQQWRW